MPLPSLKFRENHAFGDAADAAAAFADGKKQLEVAKRQVVVYSLYAPKAKSIMVDFGRSKDLGNFSL
ncbi:hypothetical protein E2562_014525 [Oryza meyeriana var. granulata]|uniref:Uncharacterized protein n=1 Tax=Oryza meyeriana var. granulata TaxID=110450 RepID=A0A6G1EIR2_9ORYZ|nr:hypothetical protein E2562_014525 [Oryza meyeriana var. granulata]